MATPIKSVSLPSGETVPALGQGTWRMAEGRRPWQEEVDALRLGIDLGLTLIDTAEMYGEGEAEKLVGDAIEGQREEIFLVSKAYPHNAGRTSLPDACERSLRRLKTETIDLYLLHWRGSTPLGETVEAFENLQREGKIRHWGVSNFDLKDLQELDREDCGADQVLYNLENRGIEYDLLPWCRERGLPIMAYSPLSRGGSFLRNSALQKVAQRHEATPAQVALAWTLRKPGLIAIPKSGNEEHVRANAAAREITLTDDDIAALDDAFPPPRSRQSLNMV